MIPGKFRKQLKFFVLILPFLSKLFLLAVKKTFFFALVTAT